MIVWIASYPRSGNTYFRMLLKHAYDVETYSLYNDPLLTRLGAEDVVGHKPLPTKVGNLRESASLYFVKTHGLPTDESPAIYVVRDGRDALISYAHFRLSYAKARSKLGLIRSYFIRDPYRHMLRLLILDTKSYGGWSGNVRAWTKARKQGYTTVVRYEDLIAYPCETVSAAIQDLELEFDQVSDFVPDFPDLQSKWPEFFRKGKTGSWRTEMPSKLQKLFWNRHGKTMEYLGYGER